MLKLGQTVLGAKNKTHCIKEAFWWWLLTQAEQSKRHNWFILIHWRFFTKQLFHLTLKCLTWTSVNPCCASWTSNNVAHLTDRKPWAAASWRNYLGTFQVFPGLCKTLSMGSLPRWIREIHPKNWGNICARLLGNTLNIWPNRSAALLVPRTGKQCSYVVLLWDSLAFLIYHRFHRLLR